MRLPTGSSVAAVCAVLSSVAVVVAGCGNGSQTVVTSTVTVTAPSDGSAPPTSGSADTSRDFKVGTFDAVRLQAHYDLVVNVGSPASVRAQGDPAALDLLDIRTEGQTLVAGVKPDEQWPANARVTVTATTPTLTAAALNGSGDIRIGPLQADSFSIDHNGSGDIEAQDLTLGKLTVTAGGSGRVQAAGTAEDANIRLSGSGEADLPTMTVKRAVISVSGSGALNVAASEEVSGSISGSGDVRVTGGAKCSVTSSGSGDAACG
jgi:hypothetical protein